MSIGRDHPAIDFNPDRFMGDWYEIAHIDNPIESGCDNAMAQYSRMPGSDLICILNTCYKGGIRQFSKSGVARVDSDVSSKLALHFDGWGKDVWNEFWIYATDYFSYALVGNTKGYCWILSRQPVMTFCQYKDLRDQAQGLGFEVKKMKVNLGATVKC